MNTGFLGAIQALNGPLKYASSGVSGTDTSAEFDDCEVTVGSGMTTFRVGLPGPGGPRQRRLLPVRLGGLFFGWREYSAECLKACGPFGPQDASSDNAEA